MLHRRAAGPHKYEGNDMKKAHEKFAELKPLTKASVHALVYHVPVRAPPTPPRTTTALFLPTFHPK